MHVALDMYFHIGLCLACGSCRESSKCDTLL
jgi:hypothetical protein